MVLNVMIYFQMGQTITSKGQAFWLSKGNNMQLAAQIARIKQENSTVAKLACELFSEYEPVITVAQETVQTCLRQLIVLDCQQQDNTYLFKVTDTQSLNGRHIEDMLSGGGDRNFSRSSHIINTSGFAGHMVSVGTT